MLHRVQPADWGNGHFPFLGPCKNIPGVLCPVLGYPMDTDNMEWIQLRAAKMEHAAYWSVWQAWVCLGFKGKAKGGSYCFYSAIQWRVHRTWNQTLQVHTRTRWDAMHTICKKRNEDYIIANKFHLDGDQRPRRSPGMLAICLHRCSDLTRLSPWTDTSTQTTSEWQTGPHNLQTPVSI